MELEVTVVPEVEVNRLRGTRRGRWARVAQTLLDMHRRNGDGLFIPGGTTEDGRRIYRALRDIQGDSRAYNVRWRTQEREGSTGLLVFLEGVTS